MVREIRKFQCEVCDTAYSNKDVAIACESLPFTDFKYEEKQILPIFMVGAGRVVGRYRLANVGESFRRHQNMYKIINVKASSEVPMTLTEEDIDEKLSEA